MKILVTGGAGFIGSHLVDRLITQSHQVTIVDDLSYGYEYNINRHATFLRLDIINYRDLLQVLEKGDFKFVYHLAASATTRESSMGWNDPLRDLEVNVVGTLNILRGCVELGINPRMIYVSSAAVYGLPQYIPIDENHLLNPISPYGIHKLTGEKYVYAYSKEQGIDAVVVRIFNSYGPRQPRYVMYDFYRKLKDKPSVLEVLGTGEQLRSFGYISDTVNALTLAAESKKGIYNLGHDIASSIRELAQMMIDMMSPETEISFTGRSWKGDIKSLVPDVSKICDLGFSPKISLKEGLERTIKWFEESDRMSMLKK